MVDYTSPMSVCSYMENGNKRKIFMDVKWGSGNKREQGKTAKQYIYELMFIFSYFPSKSR